MTNSTIVAAIVIGSLGLVLMVLGSIFYLTHLGNVPSRKAVGSEPEKNNNVDEEEEEKKEVEDVDDREKLITPQNMQEPRDSSGLDDIETGRGDRVPQPPGESSDTSSSNPLETTGHPKSAAKDDLIELYVPAGKLGFILAESSSSEIGGGGGGPPVVHEIRQASIMEESLQVGDRLIALDDEDVRHLRAETVARLIARKTENTTRKLSILRRTNS